MTDYQKFCKKQMDHYASQPEQIAVSTGAGYRNKYMWKTWYDEYKERGSSNMAILGIPEDEYREYKKVIK